MMKKIFTTFLLVGFLAGIFCFSTKDKQTKEKEKTPTVSTMKKGPGQIPPFEPPGFDKD